MEDPDSPLIKYSNQQHNSFLRTVQSLTMMFILASGTSIVVYIQYSLRHGLHGPEFMFLYVLLSMLFVTLMCLWCFWNFRPINLLVVIAAFYIFGLSHSFVLLLLLKNVNKLFP